MNGRGQSTAVPGPIEDAATMMFNCDPVDLPELHLGLEDINQSTSGVDDEEEMEEEDDEVNVES